MKNKNLDLFILTYKDFHQYVNNDCYQVVSCVDDKINTTLNVIYDTKQSNEKNNIDQSITEWNAFYSELTMTYWLWKNYTLKDYVGICHYRRYFSFMDDIPNMDEIFKDYDVILPTPFALGNTVYQQYASCHSIKDIDLMLDIIRLYFPQYLDDANEVMRNNMLYPCNIFIMRKDDFNDYCEFIFSVIDKYLKHKKYNNVKDVEDELNKTWRDYGKVFYPNNQLWYQLRIGGFLSERLLSIFVHNRFKKIKHFNVNVTEEKYRN